MNHVPDFLEHEGAHRAGAEFVAGHLALPLPLLAVGVEDPVAEKIVEGRGDEIGSRVAVEVRFSGVFDIGRVSGEHDRGDGDGARRAREEELGGPVDGPMAVLDEQRKASNEWEDVEEVEGGEHEGGEKED